jgi:hypothetical protein
MRRFFAKKGSGAYPIIKPAVRLRAVTFFLEGAGRKRVVGYPREVLPTLLDFAALPAHKKSEEPLI